MQIFHLLNIMQVGTARTYDSTYKQLLKDMPTTWEALRETDTPQPLCKLVFSRSVLTSSSATSLLADVWSGTHAAFFGLLFPVRVSFSLFHLATVGWSAAYVVVLGATFANIPDVLSIVAPLFATHIYVPSVVT